MQCWTHFFLLILFIERATSEEFNLFGEAGQAYSIQVELGHPPQKVNLIVDTGSSTLAVASNIDYGNNGYFHPENSSTLYDSGKEVQAKYSQGMWTGHLAKDYVHLPSLPSIPEAKSELALITKSNKFFMNGSGWQGLLGLAYLPVGAYGEKGLLVGSWLDSLDLTLNRTVSFSLKLCGPKSTNNATHFGNFSIIDNITTMETITFKTPILYKRWYEVGVLSIHVVQKQIITLDRKAKNKDGFFDPKEDICKKLNAEKSIVDSGTTNIRLPDILFRQIVDGLKNAAQASNLILNDGFWYNAEAACWPEPQKWSLPLLAVDLLSADANNQYFTLEIPPKNFMRIVSAHNRINDNETESEYCYKLGIEAGGKETVLGYTAMEGFEVVFNRAAGWIGFKKSTCGPQVYLTGPYNSSKSFISLCKLQRQYPHVITSIQAAQWVLFIVCMIAAGVIVYLLAPCVKMLMVRPLPMTSQISMSQTALVEEIVA